MDILDIPFIKKVGIRKNNDGQLELVFDHSLLNHLQTIHASALFTLAETASGRALQIHFPELVGKVIPVLRDSQLKFRKPADSSVTAYSQLADDAIAKFNEQFERKGRSTIDVAVEIKDEKRDLICTGTFNWFVQRLEN